MNKRSKIKNVLGSVAIIALGLQAFNANGQNNSSFQEYTKINRKVTIGFETGRRLSFSLYDPSLKKLKRSADSKSLVVRVPLNQHFKVQTGLNLNVIKMPASSTLNNRLPTAFSPLALSIPATVEYHFCKKSKKLRPYIGAGFQYSLLNANDTRDLNNADWLNTYSLTQPGYKTVSVIFTQGIIYEINTKIQVTQSFHFMPSNTNRTIGINLGIGFTLP